MRYQDFIDKENVKIEGASLHLAKKTHNIAEINKLAEKGYVPAIELAILHKAKNGEKYEYLKDLFEKELPKELLVEGKIILNEKINNVEPQYIKRKRKMM